MSGSAIPAATYRIQFNPEFDFAAAEKIAPYLRRLGIGSIYASPSLAAKSDSQHGYDVADPSRVNRQLGGESAFLSLSNRLRNLQMGILLDIVPNHMAASTENPWWTDLLTYGRASRYAEAFDIDWDPVGRTDPGTEKLMLPVLGSPFGTALENREITLDWDSRGFWIRYFELRLPVALTSYPVVLRGCERANSDDDRTAAHLRHELAESLEQVRRARSLPSDPERNSRRLRQMISRIERLRHESGSFRDAMDDRIREVNGRPGDPQSFLALEGVLDQQAYRLAWWKRAADEINYRRFFDISELVGVRVENEDVFRERHALILQLVREGRITGLRVDHVDGLYDPWAYLNRLQRSVAPGWNGDPRELPFHVVIEKILGADETLPESFAAGGTSGYDYMASLNSLFIDPAGLAIIDAGYRSFTGIEQTFEELSYQKKKQILGDLFWGDARRLGDHLIQLAREDRHGRDIRARNLAAALVEVTASLSVYRTYIRERHIEPQDRMFIEQALKAAASRMGRESRALAFLRRVLLLEIPEYAAEQEAAWLEFVMRWQQFTGRVTAKGVEDTTFYIYNRLISMNEVGGEPGLDVRDARRDFDRYNAESQRRWRRGLNATSTHDTKRSEDVRARINVISEMPTAWNRELRRWSAWNAGQRKKVGSLSAPDPNEEILIYQTLLGVWPLEPSEEKDLPARMEQYLLKALREAKVHTNWHEPDDDYEHAVLAFARNLIERPDPRFRQSMQRLQRKISFFGAVNSLAQLVLKSLSPGIPDFYQGTETWDFSLVDPDNRRPVNYENREAMLASLLNDERPRVEIARELLRNWKDGRIKLFTTERLLDLRRRNCELFDRGKYLPLSVRAVAADRVVAFARKLDDSWVIAAVPRYALRLVRGERFPLGERTWKSGRLLVSGEAPARWRNVLTDERLERTRGRITSFPLSAIFGAFPVAVLESE